METVRTVPAEAPIGAGALLPARVAGSRQVIRSGLLGGLTGAFVASIGMLVALSGRLVVKQFSLDYVILVAIPLAFGYLAAKPPPTLEGYEAPRAGPRTVAAGAAAGALAGLVMAVYIAIVGNFNLREVFPNISPDMVKRLTFGLGLPAGAAVLFLASTALAALGGWLNLMSGRVRKAVTLGLLWVVVVGLLQVVFSTVLDKLGFSFSKQLYSVSTNSLTIPGAIGVFVVTVALYLIPKPNRQQIRERFDQLPPPQRRLAAIAAVVVAVGILAVVPRLLSSDIAEDLNLAGIFLMMGLGLNIVVGVAGLLDLGYVAFFAVGAYTTAVLMSPANPINSPSKPSPMLIFWEAIPFVVLAAALAGILVGAPVLRMRGDYLAIVTLGFGEIARVLVVSTWLSRYLGGAFGIINIKPFTIGPVTVLGANPQQFFYLIFGFAALAGYISYALQDSRMGRAWMAIREDESVAEAMGVNVVAAKLWAFIIGAIIASLGGALFAVKTASVLPQTFDIIVSITVLAIVIIGGMGSIPGVVLAAVVLIGLPQVLQEFQTYRFLLYGALLIFMMLRRPEGFIPSRRRARELREEEILQDAWLRAREAERAEAEQAGAEPVVVEGS
jgi:branched-chain amino acid transport system permease protein